MNKRKFVPSVINLEDRISLSDTVAATYPPTPVTPSQTSTVPTTTGGTFTQGLLLGIGQGLASMSPSPLVMITTIQNQINQ